MEQPSSKLTLHIWPGKWDIHSIDPSCLATFYFLQLTAPGQFAVAECTNPDLSPTGTLPFLTYEHHVVASFPSIDKFVSSLKLKPSVAEQENEHTEAHSALSSAEMVAWCAHVESNMGDLVAHAFYSMETNWWKLTKPAIASMLPIPQRYYVPDRLRNSYRPRLKAVGLWCTPSATGEENDKEKEKQTLQDFIKRVHDKKEQYSRVFDRAKVLEKVRSYFDIYTRLLDRGSLSYVRPTKLDILLAAHLLLLLDPPFPDSLIAPLLTESYPSLTDYARRIQAKASESPSRILPAQNYALKSLLPWSQPGHTIKPRKRTPEDIRFDRMRWGWMALAAGSVFTYLWASGIRLVLSIPAEETVELPGDPSDVQEQAQVEQAPELESEGVPEGPEMPDEVEEVYEEMAEQEEDAEE